MDWVDSTGEAVEPANALRQPFEVLRPVPTQATARVQKVQTAKGKAKPDTKLQDILLQAFPTCFENESDEQRTLRQEACSRCWTALSQHLEAVLEQTNHATFQALLQFAATSRHAASSSDSFTNRQRVIPTALTVAGGVNSADHAQTFPTLVKLLKEQGCYAALLHPSQLPAGKGVSTAINSVLCQFSGLETDADDMLALSAWYQDQLAGPGASKSWVSPPKPPATPFGRLQLTTPAKTTRATAAAHAAAAAAMDSGLADDAAVTEIETSPTGSVTSPLAKLGINTSLGKRSAAAAVHADQAGAEVLAASERPLVVVIEEAEAVDTLTLQDLILVLSEAHAELPIVLVLGMATSAGALQQMLPVAAASVLEPQHFQLTSSMERFEAVVREVLLGSHFPGIFFGHSVMRFIDHQFLTHDFTTAVLRKGLLIACIGHFQSAPLSHLAAAAMSSAPLEELQHLVEQVPDSQAEFVTQHLLQKLPPQVQVTADEMAQQLCSQIQITCQAWSTWAVTLHWINYTAHICDDSKPRPLHTLRALYVDASSAKYAGSTDMDRMLDPLCKAIEALTVEQCIEVLKGLPRCAAKVWRGADFVRADVQASQDLISELQAGSPCKENQPAVQQPAAPAPAVAAAATRAGPSKPALAPSRQNAKHSSAANRQAAMRQQLEGAKAKAQQAQQAKVVVNWHLSMAAKVAAWLRKFVERALANPPAATPGAAILCCGKAAAAELHCLTAAPRLAIHEALATPHKYLHTPPQISLDATMDDACIAYQLFLEYGESVDVADWFSGFCAIHDSSDGMPVEEQQAPAAPKPKKKRGRPSKKVLQRDDPPVPSTSAAPPSVSQRRSSGLISTSTKPSQAKSGPGARSAQSRLAKTTSASDEPGPSGQHAAPATEAPQNRSRKSSRTSANAAASELTSSRPDQIAPNQDNGQSHTVDRREMVEEEERAGPRADAELEDGDDNSNAGGKSLEELAVRFSQATKELQVLGLLRPARKRRGDFAQKLVFHSGHADMDVAVATDC